MPAKIVLGAQWGDEAKAKVVDYLASAADVVVRYQGGANAGHTVVVGATEFVFHLVPSGILHEGKICVVGNGVVVDPATMLDEIAELEAKGFSVAGRLFVSQVAHVVMPYHKVLEKAGEESENSVAIGTTGRGIGPAYRDKVERSHGVRVMDLCDPARLRDKLRASIRAKNEILTKVFGQEPLEAGPIIDAYISYGRTARPIRGRHLDPAQPSPRPRPNQSSAKGRKGPCSTSTTAPIPTSPPRTLRRAGPAPALASAPRGSPR